MGVAGRKRLPAQPHPATPQAAYPQRRRDACRTQLAALEQHPGGQLRPIGASAAPGPTCPTPPASCAPALSAGCAMDVAAGPMFVVNEVLNASGGRTGCFLYKGRLVSAAPRSATPDYRCPALHGGAGELAGVQEVPQLSLCGDEQQDLVQYEGQQLTLYFRWAGLGLGDFQLGGWWPAAGGTSVARVGPGQGACCWLPAAPGNPSRLLRPAMGSKA